MSASNIPYSDYYTNFSTDHHLFSLIQQNHSYSKLDFIPHILGNNNMVPLMSSPCDVNSPDPASAASFSDLQQCYGISSDCMTVPALLECDSGFRDFAANSATNCYIDHHVYEPGADRDQFNCPSATAGFMEPNVHTMPMSAYYDHMMGVQAKPEGKVHEETEVKVGRYSVEEKKDRILRYLKKRNQRNFNKTIKYACRKTLADKRIRIRGRFARNSSSVEPSEEDERVVKSTSDHSYNEDTNSFYEDSSLVQMKYDEEEWFETAMANLMHLTYTPS